MRGRSLYPGVSASSAYVWALTVALGGTLAGCSEPAQCQAPTEISFEAVAPDLQTDVHLTSSLATGDMVALEVASADGTSIATMSAPAEADGNVTFRGVSMPPPHVVLHATAKGTCGIARAELAVDIGSGGACALSLSPVPETNAYYAPMGVLSSLSDPDDHTPGYQATVQVATLPGWTAELFETSSRADGEGVGTSSEPADVSLGRITAAANGVASQAVTVPDGQRGFYAICRGPGSSQASSPSTTVLADTTPPPCSLTSPLWPSTITRRYDTSPAAGWQLAVAAHADGGDVVGEAVELLVGKQGSSPSPAALPAVDASGASAASVALAAGSSGNYDFALTMRDHAGNLCAVAQTFDVEPDACDLSVTSPTTLSVDADRDPSNGSQVALAIQIAAPRNVPTACTQQLVSVTCGIDAPSTFTDSRGRTVLRPTICAGSPCASQRMCVVEGRGTRPNGTVLHTKTAVVVTFNDTAPNDTTP